MDEKKKMPEASEKTPEQERIRMGTQSARTEPERIRMEPESRAPEPIRLMPFHRAPEPDRSDGAFPGREPLLDQRPVPGQRLGYGCRRCGMQRDEFRENSVWQDGGFGRGMAGRGLPFYMTSPMYWEEDAARRDLDYLVSLYPAQAKRFQDRIMKILDTMDYRGSMIYDEYPDRMALERLAATVTAQIRRDEETAWKEKEDLRDSRISEGETPSRMTRRSEAEWEQLGEMIQILLFMEIFRRRQGAGRRKYFFMDR